MLYCLKLLQKLVFLICRHSSALFRLPTVIFQVLGVHYIFFFRVLEFWKLTHPVIFHLLAVVFVCVVTFSLILRLLFVLVIIASLVKKRRV